MLKAMNNRNQWKKLVEIERNVRESFVKKKNAFQGEFQFSKIPSRKSISHFHTF